MKYKKLDPSMLTPRPQIIGYVKVGGLAEKVSWSQRGTPWFRPERYVDPPRFAVTTRHRKNENVRNPKTKQLVKVTRGYERDVDFHRALGDENPQSLRVRLMYERAADNFTSRLAAHDGKRWVCEGDGVTASDIARGEGIQCPCPRLASVWRDRNPGDYDGPRTTTKPPCKVDFRLWVILEDAESFGAFHLFKTTSWESANNLTTTLEQFEKQFAWVDGEGVEHGGLRGLPLELHVSSVAKSFSGDGGTTAQPIVSIVLPATFDVARQIAAAAQDTSRQFLESARIPEALQLRAAVEEDAREEADAEAAEFHPIEVVESTPTEPTGAERVRARAAQEEAGGVRVFKTTSSESIKNLPVVPPQPKKEDQPQPDPARERWLKRYFAAVGKLGWSEVERKSWQVVHFGAAKHSCKTWTAEDFKAALKLIDDGNTNAAAAVPVPEPTKQPEEELPETGDEGLYQEDDESPAFDLSGEGLPGW